MSMKITDERPNRIPWPPVILLGLVAVALLLDTVSPLPFGRGAAADILGGAGFVLIVLAVLLYILSAREMKRHNTTLMPNKAAGSLVTSGPFAVSRNPIYLASIMLLAGLGLAAGNLWMLLSTIACGFLLYHLAVRREEAHLEHKFGKAWRDYKKRVRRWI
jgi:protein-S-isoprenylcysteine O-methyltransferase Ste14